MRKRTAKARPSPWLVITHAGRAVGKTRRSHGLSSGNAVQYGHEAGQRHGPMSMHVGWGHLRAACFEWPREEDRVLGLSRLPTYDVRVRP